MLRLMRRLRSAQLGKSINVAETTELLELALPELDVELLAGVGGKLDELESLRGELAALHEADAASGRSWSATASSRAAWWRASWAPPTASSAPRGARPARSAGSGGSASRPSTPSTARSRHRPRRRAARARPRRAAGAARLRALAGGRGDRRRAGARRRAGGTRTPCQDAVGELRDEEAVLASELSAAGGSSGRRALARRRGRGATRGLQGARDRRPAAAPAARARGRAARLRPAHPAGGAAPACRAVDGGRVGACGGGRQRVALAAPRRPNVNCAPAATSWSSSATRPWAGWPRRSTRGRRG